MVANFGVLFQLPTLFMGLAKFDLIDVNELKHYRKYIYFGCFVVEYYCPTRYYFEFIIDIAFDYFI